jgi:hypothetical protein
VFSARGVTNSPPQLAKETSKTPASSGSRVDRRALALQPLAQKKLMARVVKLGVGYSCIGTDPDGNWVEFSYGQSLDLHTSRANDPLRHRSRSARDVSRLRTSSRAQTS